jgi:hypothetical protein
MEIRVYTVIVNSARAASVFPFFKIYQKHSKPKEAMRYSQSLTVFLTVTLLPCIHLSVSFPLRTVPRCAAGLFPRF